MEAFTITPAAEKRIMEVTDKDCPYLRLALRGGGCNGFEYQYSLEPDPQSGDHKFIYGDSGLLVDFMTMQYLVGGQLDYKMDLSGSMFTVNSPQSTGSCGCGMSVSF